MVAVRVSWLWLLGLLALPSVASAQVGISYAQALALARERTPALAVARATEGVAEANARAAGIYPNPTLLIGTNTQTARLSLGASIPLLVLGQRGAALEAGRAELAVTKLDTQGLLVDIRATTAHAFVALWLAEHTATARADAAALALKLETAVNGRVELGSAPELEGLRVHAERLRAEMDAETAKAFVATASTELASWIGRALDAPLRVTGDPQVPDLAPALASLSPRIEAAPRVRHALAEARASEARAASERAQVRPAMSLDLGTDRDDPTLPGTNYRAQLGIELPLLNQRGPLIEREERREVVARAQAHTERVRSQVELLVAYRSFVAYSQQARTLSEGVVPAAARAARAIEESYALGRAPLVAVLDAERARIEAELNLIETQSARANAWIDVERALGAQ